MDKGGRRRDSKGSKGGEFKRCIHEGELFGLSIYKIRGKAKFRYYTLSVYPTLSGGVTPDTLSVWGEGLKFLV